LTISFKNITSILKRRVVLLLPNALTICANGRKVAIIEFGSSNSTCNFLHLQLVFSSFKNRNQAFNHLFKVWQNVLMENVSESQTNTSHY